VTLNPILIIENLLEHCDSQISLKSSDERTILNRQGHTLNLRNNEPEIQRDPKMFSGSTVMTKNHF